MLTRTSLRSRRFVTLPPVDHNLVDAPSVQVVFGVVLTVHYGVVANERQRDVRGGTAA